MRLQVNDMVINVSFTTQLKAKPGQLVIPEYPTFRSSIRAYLVFCTMNYTGLVFLNECSTSWQWLFTGVFKIKHRGTWSTAAFQSLTSPADNISDLPVVTCWLFLVFDEIHSAVGPSLSGVRWLGIHCLTVFGTHHTAAVVSGVISRQSCSQDTSVPNALEMLHDNALYKFNIDIDTDIPQPDGIVVLTDNTSKYKEHENTLWKYRHSIKRDYYY